jgi:hypothetical protein
LTIPISHASATARDALHPTIRLDTWDRADRDAAWSGQRAEVTATMAAGGTMAEVAATFREFLAALIDADLLDVVVDAAGAVEAIGEEWTLHLEGWPERPLAWLALDDEPDDPAEVAAALQEAINGETVAALAAADARLGGALARALGASGDPLSRTLADQLSLPRRTT